MLGKLIARRLGVICLSLAGLNLAIVAQTTDPALASFPGTTPNGLPQSDISSSVTSDIAATEKYSTEIGLADSNVTSLDIYTDTTLPDITDNTDFTTKPPGGTEKIPYIYVISGGSLLVVVVIVVVVVVCVCRNKQAYSCCYCCRPSGLEMPRQKAKENDYSMDKPKQTAAATSDRRVTSVYEDGLYDVISARPPTPEEQPAAETTGNVWLDHAHVGESGDVSSGHSDSSGQDQDMYYNRPGARGSAGEREGSKRQTSRLPRVSAEDFVDDNESRESVSFVSEVTAPNLLYRPHLQLTVRGISGVEGRAKSWRRIPLAQGRGSSSAQILHVEMGGQEQRASQA